MLPMLAVALLAGCTSTPPVPPAEELQWAPMTVQATSLQPPELQGTYHLAWRDGRFGMLTEGVAGLPVHSVVEGLTVSTSTMGQAWIRWSLPEYQATHPLAIRYTIWDLPRLLDSAPDATTSGELLTASLDLDGRDGAETHVELRKEGGRIVAGRVETPLDPESPFTFTREDPHPFPMVAEPALEQVPAADGDAQAVDGHHVLLAWIAEYEALLGTYPADVTPDTLLLQSFQKEWPVSPYDGKPMADRDAEGHFLWERCSDQDATFTGIGWDGVVLEQSFGRGCSKGSSPEESVLPDLPVLTV
jgi:hypothetical protein